MCHCQISQNLVSETLGKVAELVYDEVWLYSKVVTLVVTLVFLEVLLRP